MDNWAGPAIGGAALAALGYVAKSFAEWYQGVVVERKRRRARLVELFALIRAGDAAFRVQKGVRDELTRSIRARAPELDARSFDRLFASAHSSLTADERELFDVVRAYTMHTFRTLNDSLLDWISKDVDFRVALDGESPRARLALYLGELEAHLLLWRAKYDAWIPNRPERALVYLGDEEKHGVQFPKDGARLVKDVLDLGA